MIIDFSDGIARRWHETYREQLQDAQIRYASNHTEEARQDYLRALKVFADLVIEGQIPKR